MIDASSLVRRHNESKRRLVGCSGVKCVVKALLAQGTTGWLHEAVECAFTFS